MPVVAKLSKEFYEQFGEDVVDQLENWLNQVGEACRADVRLFCGPVCAPADSLLQQRVAQLRAETSAAVANLRSEVESRLAALEEGSGRGSR